MQIFLGTVRNLVWVLRFGGGPLEMTLDNVLLNVLQIMQNILGE